jgi:hypothetical protein
MILVMGDLCIGGITQGVIRLDGQLDLYGFSGYELEPDF